MRQRETAIRERDRLNNEVDELNNRLLLMKEYSDELLVAKNEFEAKNKELYKLLDETSSEAFKDKRLVETLRAELLEVTADRDQKLDELSHFKTKSDSSHKSSIQHNLQIAALKSNIERLSTQITVQSMKLSKLTGEFENLTHVKEKLLHDLGVKSNILKVRVNFHGLRFVPPPSPTRTGVALLMLLMPLLAGTRVNGIGQDPPLDLSISVSI